MGSFGLERSRGRVSHAKALAACTGAALLAGGAMAAGAIPGSNGTINGCYAKKTGTLRVVSASTKCKSSETHISWNQKGLKGDTGAAGPAGARGAIGPAGPSGLAATNNGTAGPAGPAGPEGPQGPKGDKGDKGDTGDIGTAGVNGVDGVDGVNGVDGAQGIQGLKGDTGAAGATGATGLQGPAGPTGPAGANGVSGLEIITATSVGNSDTKRNVTATCPGTKTLVGGGARTTNTAAWVTTSGPGAVASGKANSWIADAEEHDTLPSSTQWTLTVYAICATAS